MSNDNISSAAEEEAIAEYYGNAENEKNRTEAKKGGNTDRLKSDLNIDTTDAAFTMTGSASRLRFHFNIDDALIEEIYEFPERGISRLLFCSCCIFAASLILCGSFYAASFGADNDDTTDILLSRLRSSDSEYMSADAENRMLNDEMQTLAQQALDSQEKNSSINDFDDAKRSKEAILQAAKETFQAKNDELYSLNQELEALKQAQSGGLALELTPGTYSVGKNIPEGSYDIIGTGSLIASTAEHEVRVNTALSTDTPTRVTLKSGYTVKINCKATLTPAGA
ncbi:MAG: hypothetical protein SOS24_00050 [Clostridia bacterium]|nr:hypothetical protein [Clostridia bacterium]